jgi:hypothetical protein
LLVAERRWWSFPAVFIAEIHSDSDK